MIFFKHRAEKQEIIKNALHKKRNLRNFFFSFKLPLSIIGILIAIFLTIVTFMLTYRYIIDMRGFFEKTSFIHKLVEKEGAFTAAFLLSIAALVESVPYILDKLMYWGQIIDNLIRLKLFQKIYFLDEIDGLLNQARLLIDKANQNMLIIYKTLVLNKPSRDFCIKSMSSLKKLLQTEIKKTENLLNKGFELIEENNAYDSLNKQRHIASEESLNNFTLKLFDTFSKNRLLYQEINKYLKGMPKNQKNYIP